METAKRLSLLAALFSLYFCSGISIAQQPEVTEATLAQAISQARNFGNPITGPARGFKFEGEITFSFPNNEITKTREFKSWVGGHGRLRYRLGNVIDAHIFLLRDFNTAWLKPQNKDQFNKTEARELAVQNWMRWTIARLPRDNEHILSAYPLNTKQVKLSSPFGTINLLIDEDHLPRELIHPELKLSVDDWKETKSGELIPHTWTWESEFNKQVEVVSQLDWQILIYDHSFSPPLPDQTTIAHSTWSGTGSAFTGEEFGIVNMPEVTLVLNSSLNKNRRSLITEGKIGNSHWRLVESARPFGPYSIVHNEAALPKDAITISFEAGNYLRWVTIADNDFEDDHADLLKVAKENELKVSGTVRFSGPTDTQATRRRELLVPISIE